MSRTASKTAFKSVFTRRRLLAGLFSPPALAIARPRDALAQAAATFRSLRVDASPLRANAGDPTAAWVERELPGALARALQGRMTRNGNTLVVRIDTLTLGPSTGANVHSSVSIDNIGGVAIVNGGAIPVRATSNYSSSPIDQTMIEQSNHSRVSALLAALADWIGKGAFF